MALGITISFSFSDSLKPTVVRALTVTTYKLQVLMLYSSQLSEVLGINIAIFTGFISVCEQSVVLTCNTLPTTL